MLADARRSGDVRIALAAGAAAVGAWAEVLDRINVFPVADGDTGRNLVVSLAPLRDVSLPTSVLTERLLLSARGNSGNIACSFIRSLLDGGADESWASRCARGAAEARRAVATPQPGTMLTVLDALAAGGETGISREGADGLLARLAQVVRETTLAQESLRRSNVVDSGALGILVFLDEALRTYFGLDAGREDFADSFRSLVRFERSRAAQDGEPGFCIDAVVRLPQGNMLSDQALGEIGRELVVLRDGNLWKIHLHADEVGAAREALGRLGEVVGWSWDDLREQMTQTPSVAAPGEVHIVTDGAASLSRREADTLGITLLDSYIDFGDRSLPETRIDAEDLYAAMRRGVRVSTSQASVLERERHLERLTTQWPSALYLCVGSVYTGNHAVAAAWKGSHAAGPRLTVIDSGAASGRLAVVARAAALAARAGQSGQSLAELVRSALARAEEYIFLERLEYLARGGRLSKLSAWSGDALHLAPVVSPLPDGARKVAILRKLSDKVVFACDRAKQALVPSSGRGYLLMQYTDNRAWVEAHLGPRLREVVPKAEIGLGPLSLTTGAHTGPGTWAVAMLPDDVAHDT
jgi:DegV family protein with EDD domain